MLQERAGERAGGVMAVSPRATSIAMLAKRRVGWGTVVELR
jgi:hypothetical protein